MSLTLLVWLALFVVLAVRAFTNGPTYGLSLYVLTFFANPLFWWWGNDSIGAFRWNLAASIMFAVAVLLEWAKDPKRTDVASKWPLRIAIVFLLNATMVHFLLAPDPAVSFDRYVLVVKFVILFVVMAATIYDVKAFRLALWSMTLGAAYIGYEVTINRRGQFVAGRLQGIGAAGVQEPNELAALMGTVLPLAAGLFFTGTTREKIGIAILGPLILNVVLLCNSRGTFVALICGVVVFLVTTRGAARKKVLRGFALGAVALVLLLRDPEIVNRFMTVFASAEERDDSAAGRLVIWGVAATVLADHPFGSGGDGFNRVYSRQYLETGRSVHNGFLSEAVEWGVQGLAIKLVFLLAGIWMVTRTAWRPGVYDAESMVLASCLITATAILVVASLFADFLDNEWGYWLVGLMLGYVRVYKPRSQPTEPTARV
jgi:O-antigen ligase